MLQHKGLESLDSLCLILQPLINHGKTGIFCNLNQDMEAISDFDGAQGKAVVQATTSIAKLLSFGSP